MLIRFIKPSYEIDMLGQTGIEKLKMIERAGKTCYKAEYNITEDSYLKFVEMITKRGHLSVIEHSYFSVRVICDRGISHEIVRHRLMSFSQESTRYCAYNNAMEFIIPSWCDIEPFEDSLDDFKLDYPKDHPGYRDSLWCNACADSAISYKELLDSGWRPEQARSVLPNSLKTEIVITGNLRNWQHFFLLRDHSAAHPDMRTLAHEIHNDIKNLIPIMFD